MIITSLSLASQRKNKQTNKQTKTQHTLYKLTQTTGPTLRGKKPKRRKNSTFKPGKRRPQTVSFKKKMKRQRNTAQIKEQIRNTEVQINEKEIGKLPEKEFRIMIVKIIKKP